MNIYELIAQGEHQQQDFKYMISSVTKIAHSVSAFANTDGGRLLVGVRDNGKIAGVKSEEEIYMIDAAAQTRCQPPVECLMETIREGGMTVLIASIPMADERPVCAIDEDGKPRAYIRVEDENIVASPIHLELWRQEGKDTGELQVFTDIEKEHLQLIAAQQDSEISLNNFCKRTRMQRKRAIRTLARWVRFGIVELVLKEHKWVVKIV
ncbi:MAG: ATP-binding protein [Bacteroidales bacterium]|nr:ATP-binding protein [Bacteroidales bacterium]